MADTTNNTETMEQQAAEQAQEMQEAQANGVVSFEDKKADKEESLNYTHTFKTPREIEGKKYTKLTFYFEKLTGGKYSFFEEYMLDDAEFAIVCMNSTAGTVKAVVDELREQGIKAGLLKVRVFRPFPAEEIANALSHLKAVAIMDKADSLNAIGGALFGDVTSSLYVNGKNVPAVNYIYGIGGRDTTTKDIHTVYSDLQEIVNTGKIENPYRYLSVRREK